MTIPAALNPAPSSDRHGNQASGGPDDAATTDLPATGPVSTSAADWMPDLTGKDGPVYRAIADALSADIAARRLTDGARLPTHRDLAYRLGVTVGTVSRAYAEAARRGLTRGDVGRGTFVNAAPRPARSAPASVVAMAPPLVDRGRLPDRPDRIAPDGSTGRLAPLVTPPGMPGTVAAGLIDFTVNHPVSRGVAATLSQLLREVADKPDLADLLGYQPSAGLPAHRRAAASLVGQTGIAADADRIVLCNGVQHAIAIALAATTRPGETVLVERLTYHGIKSVAATLGLQLRGVDLDAHGLRPDSFAAAIGETGARVAVMVPTIQNPTCAVMPLQRRQEIVEVARREQLLILEDDIYGFLQADAPPPLAALAPDLVCYATGLSKSVAPALRTGILHAPETLVARMAAAIRATNWMTSPIMGEVAARLIAAGLAAEYGAAQREEAAARQAIARRELAGFDLVSPDAAFHLWLRLPPAWRAGEFAAVARARGVLLTPAEVFMADRTPAPEAVRLCVQACPDRRAVARGLAILRDILAAPPAAQLSIV